MKVGIFDSGIGGITVLKQALEMIPEADYIYYSDNLHVPYGTKPKEEVCGYVNDVVSFLVKEGVDAIVIACNTATSVAVHHLRKQYDLPIIGMEPAVKLALDHCAKGKILATATPLALKEEKFRNLVEHIDGKHRVEALPLPELVLMAEERNFDKVQLSEYFKEKLSSYNLDEFSGMVLGCTHFVYFKKFLEEILPSHITVFDGNEGTVRHLRECLPDLSEEVDRSHTPCVTFYYSGKKCTSNELLEDYLKRV